MATPVITTTGGALPEIAGEAASKIHPGDVEALAGAIIEMLMNEELQKSFAMAGIDRARKFTWQQTAKRMFNLYASLP